MTVPSNANPITYIYLQWTTEMTFTDEFAASVMIHKGSTAIGFQQYAGGSVAHYENCLFENIVDKNGNKRFMAENWITDVLYSSTHTQDEVKSTFTYNKYAVSGTHIMFVLAGYVDPVQFPNGMTFNNGLELGSTQVRQWISDGLSPWFKYGNAKIRLLCTRMYYETNWSGIEDSIPVISLKWGNQTVHARICQDAVVKGGYRFQFDFIIE